MASSNICGICGDDEYFDRRYASDRREGVTFSTFIVRSLAVRNPDSDQPILRKVPQLEYHTFPKG